MMQDSAGRADVVLGFIKECLDQRCVVAVGRHSATEYAIRATNRVPARTRTPEAVSLDAPVAETTQYLDATRYVRHGEFALIRQHLAIQDARILSHTGPDLGWRLMEWAKDMHDAGARTFLVGVEQDGVHSIAAYPDTDAPQPGGRIEVGDWLLLETMKQLGTRDIGQLEAFLARRARPITVKPAFTGEGW